MIKAKPFRGALRTELIIFAFSPRFRFGRRPDKVSLGQGPRSRLRPTVGQKLHPSPKTHLSLRPAKVAICYVLRPRPAQLLTTALGRPEGQQHPELICNKQQKCSNRMCSTSTYPKRFICPFVTHKLKCSCCSRSIYIYSS